MRRRNLRRLPRVSYSELEEPSLDEYIFCEKCGDFVFEYCSIHGPLLVVPDDEVPAKSPYPPCVPRAALTIPHVFLHIAPSVISGAGLGIFSTLTLPRGVRFGPYRGTATKKVSSMYCWQIRDSNNKCSHAIDASDADASNWMRYVNCSRHWREQNLIAYQYQGQIYYRTIKIIPRFTELMVFYGSEFAHALNIDLRRYNSPAGYAQKYGLPAPKKRKQDQDSKQKLTLLPEHQEKDSGIEDKNNNTTNVCEERHESAEMDGNGFRISKNNQKHFTVAEKNKEVLDENDNNMKIIENTDYNEQTKIAGNSDLNHLNNVCDKCGTNFKSKESYNVHMKTIHTDSKHDLYSCNYCNKAFNRKHYLSTHIRIHTGEKPYQCKYCNKAFSDKSNLSTHIRIHTGEKPYQCKYCNKAFSDKSHLSTHIRIHTGEKPYQCKYCNKAFSDKSHLSTHIRIHTGEKPYQCKYCNKAFGRNDNLSTHIRIHTGEKPYQCEYCNKSFSVKINLSTHIRIHTGEKPYQCEYCNKAFSDKSHLSTHIRIHTGEKPYQCKYCNKAFSVKSHLSTHIRIHTGEKPYQCKYCNKKFGQNVSLSTHIRIHTGEKFS